MAIVETSIKARAQGLVQVSLNAAHDREHVSLVIKDEESGSTVLRVDLTGDEIVKMLAGRDVHQKIVEWDRTDRIGWKRSSGKIVVERWSAYGHSDEECRDKAEELAAAKREELDALEVVVHWRDLRNGHRHKGGNQHVTYWAWHGPDGDYEVL